MSLNQGIQKYRDSIRASNAKAKAQASTKATQKTQTAADPKAQTATPKKAAPEPKQVAKAEVDTAVLEKVTADEASKEEEALQKEIAEELERDAATTAKL